MKYRYVLEKLGYDDFKFEKFSNNLESKIPALKGSFVAKQEGMLRAFGPLGFNALPNIVCYAKKTKKDVDYSAAIRSILEKCLVGREEKILDVWMRDVEGKI